MNLIGILLAMIIMISAAAEKNKTVEIPNNKNSTQENKNSTLSNEKEKFTGENTTLVSDNTTLADDEITTQSTPAF